MDLLLQVDVFTDFSEHAQPRRPEILIVTLDPVFNDQLRSALSPSQFALSLVSTFDEAKRRLAHAPPDLLVTALRLGAFNGLHLAVRSRASSAATRILMIGDADDRPLRREAEAMGAVWLEAPFTLAAFRIAVERVTASARV